MQDALKHATAVPYATAQKCIAVARLAEPVGAKGNGNVVSDAATALYLAFGAFQSAVVNININLASIKDDAFLADWHARVADLRAEMDAAYAAAKPAIEGNLGVGL
jgi:formiminotetrahydrofolate cyclodeaminase